MKSYIIHFIRHGAIDETLSGKYIGTTDVPLSEKGRLDLPGRPLLYGTTPDFLRCFCLSSLSELPELPDKVDDAVQAENDDEIDNEQGEQIRNFFRSDE